MAAAEEDCSDKGVDRTRLVVEAARDMAVQRRSEREALVVCLGLRRAVGKEERQARNGAVEAWVRGEQLLLPRTVCLLSVHCRP